MATAASPTASSRRARSASPTPCSGSASAAATASASSARTRTSSSRASTAPARSAPILVPLNYRLVAADHEYIINHAGVNARARRLRVHARRRRDPPAPAQRSSTGSSPATAAAPRRRLDRLGRLDRAPPSDAPPPPIAHRRERPRLDQLHLRHHRAAEGRDADAPQLLPERLQPDRPPRRPPRRRRAVDAADVPLQRLGRRLRAHRAWAARTSSCAPSTARDDLSSSSRARA